jgi:surfactin synthase thioesterase subunit
MSDEEIRQAYVALFRSDGMQVPEITKDLEKLAAMSDEEVNAELRKMGATDEEIRQMDEWAKGLVEKMCRPGATPLAERSTDLEKP